MRVSRLAGVAPRTFCGDEDLYMHAQTGKNVSYGLGGAKLPFNPLEIWHWITGTGSGDAATAAALAEVAVHRFVIRRRRKHEAKVLDALRMGGTGSGWSLTDEQIAGQNGWEPKKARSALKRLERKGKVYQAEGRWYLGPATVTSKTLSS